MKSASLNRQLVKICGLIKTAMAGDGIESIDEADAAATQIYDADDEPGSHDSEMADTRKRLSQKSRQPRQKLLRRPKFYLAGLAIVVVVVIGTILGLSKLKRQPAPSPPPTARPLTTVEFHDEFDNPSFWQTPPSGWSIKNGRMLIDSQQQIGYVTNKNYGDFEMAFHLKLENGKGAAWALRVQPDGRNYYLFYLSASEGQIPNRFLTYIVRDGKLTPTLFASSVPLIEKPVADGQYQITATVKGNHFTHKIESSQTSDEFKLGDFTDEDNTFASGSVGLRAIDEEKFSVDSLFVRPPNIKPE